jgi:hypothetical protein
MSFGLLKHFKDLKKGEGISATPIHYHHIVLGHDLGSVLKLMEIKRKHPEDKVRMISTRPLNRQALIENHEYGPSLLRSPKAVENIYKHFYDAKILPLNKGPVFYKDGKFHDFAGRAKSMDLLSGEEFFVSPGYRIEISSLFSPEDWASLDEVLKEYQEVRIFESIEKCEPTDLVDRGHWLLTFKDFARMTCEELYVDLSPKRFFNMLTNKSELTPELVDLCSSVKIQAGITVTWVLDEEIWNDERTLFIPQSMTHEWGHFIVEFGPYIYNTKTQLCHVLFLIHEEEPQTEDMVSKIKLMKRVLDRVFPDIEKHITKEFIRFDEEMFVSDIKEGPLEQVGFDYPHLKFLGQASAVPLELAGEKFLSRTLLSH